MSYQQKSIKKIIEDIDGRKVFLPSIQRKYVWEEEQITRLMDSIMRDYPFGTFLFWKVKAEMINKDGLRAYEFIRNYDERNPDNPRASIAYKNADEDVYLVLDGQQRLTSLYISLCGSLRKKIPKKRWDNPDAFPEKELYFNVLGGSNNPDDEDKYEFAFLTKEAAEAEKNKVWFKVKDILPCNDVLDISNKICGPRGWDASIMNNLMKLHEVVNVTPNISYYEIDNNDSIDDVLDIFVRVNSGGTVLSKTDLLFSTIVADWHEARDEIDSFLTYINTIGDHYEFDSDFIMRTCLYILDMPMLMTVRNFGQKNISAIKSSWDDIKAAVKDTVVLLSELGFSSDNIISNNAILPMIYYRFKNGEDAFADEAVRNDLRRYFVISQIKKAFGGHSNQTLDILRNALRDAKKFDYEKLKTIPLAYDNDLSCDKTEIERQLDENSKGAYTFLMLTLLYPGLEYSKIKFEQDHIHPDAGFARKKLRKLVLKNGEHLTKEQMDEWIKKSSKLPNLHLLDPTTNERRQDTPLVKWLEDGNSVKCLPEGIDYSFENFEQFYEKRKEILVDLFDEKINGA